MEYRDFGSTGMRLSCVGLGGLLARYEAACGHPPPEEKRSMYRRARDWGINLFDMGYGDEPHIPDELRGPADDRYFSLKFGGPAERLTTVVEQRLTELRREALDILRLQYGDYAGKPELAQQAETLKRAGKVRALCLIRHFQADQDAYAATGPDPAADADLVIYNYVCRHQEPGLTQSVAAGKGVLIMKALGGQWLDWQQQTAADWAAGSPETVVQLGPQGEALRPHLSLIHPIVSGPWQELRRDDEPYPPPGRAVGWVLRHEAVCSALVAFASVAEMDETLGSLEQRDS